MIGSNGTPITSVQLAITHKYTLSIRFSVKCRFKIISISNRFGVFGLVKPVIGFSSKLLTDGKKTLLLNKSCKISQ